MKQKVGTVLDQRLLRRAKAVAAQRGRPLSAVIEEALRAWLEREAEKAPTASLVAQTAGNMAVEPAVLATILAEDILDAS